MGFFNNLKDLFNKFFRLSLRRKFLIFFIVFWVLSAITTFFDSRSNAIDSDFDVLTFDDGNYTYSVDIPKLNGVSYKDFTIFKNNGDSLNYYILVTYNNASYCNLTPFYSVSKNWVQISYDSKSTNFSMFKFDNVNRVLTNMVTNYNLYEVKWTSGTWTNTVINSSVNVYDTTSRDRFGTVGNVLYEITYPFFVTSQQDMESLSFNNLVVNGGSYTFDKDNKVRNTLGLRVTYNGTQYSYGSLLDYLTVNNSGLWTLEIPRDFILSKFTVANNSPIKFEIIYFNLDYDFSGNHYYILDSGDIILNVPNADELNKQAERYLQEQQLQSLDNINNALTDPTIEQSNFDGLLDMEQPSFNVFTGVFDLFDRIYRAFCVDIPQDIELVVPFVNKPFIISRDYVQTFFPHEIKDFIGVVWWGLISLFLILRIQKLIDSFRTASWTLDTAKDIWNGQTSMIEECML